MEKSLWILQSRKTIAISHVPQSTVYTVSRCTRAGASWCSLCAVLICIWVRYAGLSWQNEQITVHKINTFTFYFIIPSSRMPNAIEN